MLDVSNSAETNEALPIGWTHATVGEYLFVKNGNAFKSNSYVQPSKDTFPVIRISDLDGRNASDTTASHIRVKVEGFEINTGDLLIAMSGATTGKIGVYRGKVPAYQNQRVGNLKLLSEENGCAEYRNYLITNISDKVRKVAYGGAQPNISGKAIEQLTVSIPPLAEQKVIADKLDTLLAQVENTKARLERIPQILKRFRQSVLAAAVSGRLTEEWRKVNTWTSISSEIELTKYSISKSASKLAILPIRNDERHLSIPESWTWSRLASIAEIVSGVAKGSKTTKDVVEVPYLRVANVQRGYLDLREIKTISVPTDRVGALTLKKGDVLFNEGGDIDKLGRGWIWQDEIDHCIHQNHVFRARCYSSKMEPKFISYYGNSEGKEYFLRNGTQSVNLASINKTTLSLLPVPLPPVQEQTEIVSQVDQLFTQADTVEQQVNNALARVNNLTQSILAKAFRGELTDQWRKDNPDLISGENSAEALLERIKAERAATKPAKRSRKASA